MSKPARGAPKPAVLRKPVPASRPVWPRHAAIGAALILLAFLAYSNSFTAGFLFDSNEIILKDTRIQEATAAHISRILTGPYWEIRLAGLYRPLTTLSFLYNYAILGNGATPAGYHWVNFALHAVNIVLVYALGLLLLEETVPAALLAALWGVHPVLTEAVTNLVGRSDLLAAFGVLSALLAYIRSRRSSGRARALWLAAASVAAAIGIFSKENAAVAVALLVLYDVCFPPAASWRSRLPGYAAVAAPSILYLVARAHALAHLLYEPEAFVNNPLIAAGFWTSSLTAVKVIGKYLFLLLWPQHLSADYSYNAVPLFSWNLAAWEDWKAILALAFCLAAAGRAPLLPPRSPPPVRHRLLPDRPFPHLQSGARHRRHHGGTLPLPSFDWLFHPDHRQFAPSALYPPPAEYSPDRRRSVAAGRHRTHPRAQSGLERRAAPLAQRHGSRARVL